jgi:hypothetical protein
MAKFHYTGSTRGVEEVFGPHRMDFSVSTVGPGHHSGMPDGTLVVQGLGRLTVYVRKGEWLACDDKGRVSVHQSEPS